MADAATIGVLRDLAILVALATALGLFGYRAMRLRRPHVSWNQEGQVLSRPYAAPDLILLALLGAFFISTMQAPAGEQADAGITSAGIILSMVFNLMVCAALLLYLHRLRGLNPAELFGLQHLHWRSITRVVLVFAVICLVSVSLVAIGVTQWLEGVWPDLQPQQMVETFQSSGHFGIKLLVAIAAVVIAPLAEEQDGRTLPLRHRAPRQGGAEHEEEHDAELCTVLRGRAASGSPDDPADAALPRPSFLRSGHRSFCRSGRRCTELDLV